MEALLAAEPIDKSSVAVVGFHGQTVLHRPAARLTVQIGDGAALARRLGHDRWFMISAPPMSPPAGRARRWCRCFIRRWRAISPGRIRSPCSMSAASPTSPLSTAATPIACDTGPGNALIDDFMRARTGAPLDRDGDQAAKGRVDEDFVRRVLTSAFFGQPCPKSLDRNAFAFANIGLPDFSVADGAATLSALTAASVARVVPHLPAAPRAWIVAGGGARNPTLMRMLAERLEPATVETADAVGWSSQSIEAQAFAYLAVRTLNRLPITFPATTGVKQAMPGGIIANPRDR